MRSDDVIATLIGDSEFFAGCCDETQFGNVCTFLHIKRQGHRHPGLNASTIDFTVSLCRMTVTAGEERSRAWSKMANVNIASIFAWRDGRKSSRFTRPNPHHPAEWLVGNLNIWPEFTGGLSQFIVVQVRFWEVLGQQSEARDDRVPAPPLMFDADDIDHQGIPWFRALHIYRASERVNKPEVQVPDRLRGRIRINLAR